MAPEQCNNKMRLFFVRISKGILTYEMLTGSSPFYGDSKISTYERILSGKIEWPKHMESIAKDLIKKLLAQDRSKRLGCGKVQSTKYKVHA